jgi:hypothetical protein
MKRFVVIIISVFIVSLIVAGYFVVRIFQSPLSRSQRVLAWLNDPQEHASWAIKAKEQCPGAPFYLPTSGYIGYLWGDLFKLNQKHQGIDIFGGAHSGETPVYSIYDGFLTRQSDWKSSIIIRIPQDPLSPDRQIWVYYTHMADENGRSYISESFPPETDDLFITAGTLLGYQGNYSGDAGNPTGVHLHLSIVLSNPSGQYLNELEISNTLDPSPYFGIPLNTLNQGGEIPRCNS